MIYICIFNVVRVAVICISNCFDVSINKAGAFVQIIKEEKKKIKSSATG